MKPLILSAVAALTMALAIPAAEAGDRHHRGGPHHGGHHGGKHYSKPYYGGKHHYNPARAHIRKHVYLDTFRPVKRYYKKRRHYHQPYRYGYYAPPRRYYHHRPAVIGFNLNF